MRRLIICIITMQFAITVFAQVNEVTLTVVASGPTEEKATLQALRNAIEQTYGAFVSSNTEILNDSLVRDEIVSVSQGNVKQYKKLAVATLNNGDYSVSLNVTVSINKLITYARSKGNVVDFDGSTYATNERLLKLRAVASEKAYRNLVAQLTEIAKGMFDFELTIEEPRKVKIGEDYRYEFKGKVKVLSNVASTNFANLYQTTMNELRINKEDYDFCVKNKLEIYGHPYMSCEYPDMIYHRAYYPVRKFNKFANDGDGFYSFYEEPLCLRMYDFEDLSTIMKTLLEDIDEIGYCNPICLYNFSGYEIWKEEQYYPNFFRTPVLLVPQMKLLEYDLVLKSAIELALTRFRIVELGNEENSYQYLHFDSHGAEYDNLIDSRTADFGGLFMPWSSKKYEEFYSIGTAVKIYDRTPDKDYYYRTGEQYYKWRSFLLEDYIYGSRCLDSDFTESLINGMQSQKKWHENVELIRDLFKGVKKEDRFDYVHYPVFERDVVMYINEEDMDEFIGFELQTEGFEQKNMGLKFYDELELYKRSQVLQYHHDAFK